MLKRILEKQAVFSITLKLLAVFAQSRIFSPFSSWLAGQFAHLNLVLNKPKKAEDLNDLANTWLNLMPPDGRQYFKILKIENNTAYAEIHLHCPLRGSGNAEACYKLMNYDRKLMSKVGGNLVVLESQSNSGKPSCLLAIRKKEDDISDLVPAHLKK